MRHLLEYNSNPESGLFYLNGINIEINSIRLMELIAIRIVIELDNGHYLCQSKSTGRNASRIRLITSLRKEVYVQYVYIPKLSFMSILYKQVSI